jgi:DUF4097 and DUF4098 domain-containing protein YvlB
MQKTFDTPGPTSLYVELGSGDLNVRAEDVAETTVTVNGKTADDVIVELRGSQIVVLAAQRRTGFFGSSNDLDVSVTLPTDSELSTKIGSADLNATGRLGTAKIKTGSGDVHLDELGGDALIESGSGDIEIDAVVGELRVKSGSGDIEVDRLGAAATISTGSGDVEIGTAQGDVQVKSGSGDMRVREAHSDVALSTASGDLAVGRMHRGSLQAKNVSGDIQVGIPANVPVWTDISAVTGSVSSNLEGAGQPEEGQDYIEVRAKTVSGDILLEQL